MVWGRHKVKMMIKTISFIGKFKSSGTAIASRLITVQWSAVTDVADGASELANAPWNSRRRFA